MGPPRRPRPSSVVAEILRVETVGGALLLAAAVVALVWANSPWAAAYHALSGLRLGPAGLPLDLTVAQWASDGLLAVFFLVAGLELKRELVAGDLRDPRRAALPVAAAVGGMVVPAAFYTAVNLVTPGGEPVGWAIPTATDIAFALAVLALAGRHLPATLRTFLLTLAVVDDLLAITIIAAFYTASLHLLPLVLAPVPLAAFAWLVRRPHNGWLSGALAGVLALATWLLVHASGVHATVAGVLLGFAVPVHGPTRTGVDTGRGLAARLEHRLRPLSAGVAVPVFAFFAAGVTVGGLGAGPVAANPVTAGVVVGLVVGKPVGVLGATWLVARIAPCGIDLGDLLGLALLTGIGFTVSLLVGELAFGAGTAADGHVTIGVLIGSAASAVLATVVLRLRNRHHRRTGDPP
jgi:NhaA family Na+:H+ antiporter